MTTEQEAREEAKEHQFHTNNLTGGRQQDADSPATLKYISEPEDIDSPVEGLDWINSKSASTSNFDPEDVESKEWVIEYHQLLSRLEHPPQYGLVGPVRAWAYDDVSEFKKPLKPNERLEIEGFSEIGKEAQTRSKEGWGVETSTRDTRESIVRGQEKQTKNGLLGRLKR